MSQALKSCLKCNKLPTLVTLLPTLTALDQRKGEKRTMKYGASVATAAVVDDAIVAAADAMFAHNVKPSFAIVAAFFRSLFVVQPLLLFCVSPV